MARRLFAVLVLALLAAVALVYVGFSPDTGAEVTVRDGGAQTTVDGTATGNDSGAGNASVRVADDGGQILGTSPSESRTTHRSATRD